MDINIVEKAKEVVQDVVEAGNLSNEGLLKEDQDTQKNQDEQVAIDEIGEQSFETTELDTKENQNFILKKSSISNLGTVIATSDGPSVSKFAFVLQSATRQGNFVSVSTKEGNLLAVVEDIYKANKYFESAGAVQEYNRTSDLHEAFPIKEWEYTIASCRALGIYKYDKPTRRPTYPPAPGAKVVGVEPKDLDKFLGLDKINGLNLGKVYGIKLDAKINLGHLVKKHIAILAISGAGKSYTVSVLIEEILNRQREQGRIALVIFDTHGEYEYFKKSGFSEKVELIDAKDIKINISNFKAGLFRKFAPNMSVIQQRALDSVINILKADKGTYNLDDLIDAVRRDENIKVNVKEPLLGWLLQMNTMRLFSNADYPNITTSVKPGCAIIINLKNLTNNKKKQIIVDHISSKLFYLRRENKVPPYLQIIEEAHNFCPGSERAEDAIARSVIRTLAREGRKFNANICLVSQRPVQLDTTTLSQCNTQIIMKITNPNDLDQIKQSAEAISTPTLRMISGLRVGEALIVGSAVNHPILINVRKRKVDPGTELSLEEEAKVYEQQNMPMTGAEDFV